METSCNLANSCVETPEMRVAGARGAFVGMYTVRPDWRSFLDRGKLVCHNAKPPFLVGVPILLRSDLCGLKGAIGWFRTQSIRRDT